MDRWRDVAEYRGVGLCEPSGSVFSDSLVACVDAGLRVAGIVNELLDAALVDEVVGCLICESCEERDGADGRDGPGTPAVLVLSRLACPAWTGGVFSPGCYTQ